MKIAFVLNNYPPRTGGVELHVQSLAMKLRELGHTPIVITLGPNPSREVRDGVDVVTLSEHLRIADTLGFPQVGTKRRIAQFLRSEHVDVVSVHTRFFPMSFVGLRAARKADLPVIHTEHGSDHVTSASVLIKYASRLVDFTIGRYVLQNVDTVLGVSEEVCSFVQRLAGVEAQLFYNAIDLNGRSPVVARSRGNNLVFVGRLVSGKGWDVFLEVVRSQLADDPVITADILGDGPDRTSLENRIRDLKLEGAVQVHGRVPQAVVRDVMRGSILVNPTVLSEGFQTTLIEAIAEGGQVATYSVPGAKLLYDQGAPIRIAKERSAEALIREVSSMLRVPLAPATDEIIVKWGWSDRAQQYLEIAAKVLAIRAEN